MGKFNRVPTNRRLFSLFLSFSLFPFKMDFRLLSRRQTSRNESTPYREEKYLSRPIPSRCSKLISKKDGFRIRRIRTVLFQTRFLSFFLSFFFSKKVETRCSIERIFFLFLSFFFFLPLPIHFNFSTIRGKKIQTVGRLAFFSRRWNGER